MTDIVERLRTAADRAGEVFDPGFYNPWQDAADEIERLRKLIGPMDWRPMETAPKDGTRILAYGWGDNRITKSRWSIREIWCEWNDTYRYVPTENGLYRQQACRSNERWEPYPGFHPEYWTLRPETPDVDE